MHNHEQYVTYMQRPGFPLLSCSAKGSLAQSTDLPRKDIRSKRSRVGPVCRDLSLCSSAEVLFSPALSKKNTRGPVKKREREPREKNATSELNLRWHEIFSLSDLSYIILRSFSNLIEFSHISSNLTICRIVLAFNNALLLLFRHRTLSTMQIRSWDYSIRWSRLRISVQIGSLSRVRINAWNITLFERKRPII